MLLLTSGPSPFSIDIPISVNLMEHRIGNIEKAGEILQQAQEDNLPAHI